MPAHRPEAALSGERGAHELCYALRMTDWQKPSFEELAMNAEIGAYQAEDGEDDRGQEPFVQSAPEEPAAWAIPVHCG